MTKNSKADIIRLAVALLATVAFLAALYKMGGIWFENNDDVFISETLSGKITGTPEWHNPHIGTLLTFPIACLYSLTNAVPWWGLFLFLILFSVIFLNVYVVLTGAGSWIKAGAFFVIEMCAFVAGIHCFGQTQYTCVAILLAFVGYAMVLFNAESKGALAGFIICEFLSCTLRIDSMMLVQPIGMLGLFGTQAMKYFKKRGIKKLFRRLLPFVVTVFSVIILTKAVNAITFSSPEWKAFNRFHDFRIYVMDYEPKVPYETIADTLNKHGISRVDYEQFLDYRFWYGDNRFSGEAINDLLPIFRSIRESEAKKGNFFAAFMQLLVTSREFWHLHQVTFFVFAVSVVMVLLFRKRAFLFPILSVFAGYLMSIGFLGFRNRFVLRVLMPTYLGTILLLVIIMARLFCELTKSDIKEPVKIVLTSFFTVLFMAFSLHIGRVQFAYVRLQNKLVNTNAFAEARELAEYCRSHEEEHYIFDMSFARFVSTDIFERDYYRRANHVYSGSWVSGTPTMITYCKDYLKDGFSVFVYEAQEYRGLPGVDFYSDKFGREAVLSNKFKLSTGATMWVYKIAGN